MFSSFLRNTLLKVVDGYWLFLTPKISTQKYWRFVRHFSHLLFPSAGGNGRLARIYGNTHILVNYQEKAGRDIIAGVDFERLETEVVKNLIKPGDIFFDVGANTGYYSLLASELVASGGFVHAFEPASITYEILHTNTRLNGLKNILLNRLAVSDKPGEAELLINTQSGLTSMGNTRRGEFIGVEKVQVITLDEYVKDNQITRVDFLKLDIEGFEGHVLRGAKRLMHEQKDMVILIELAEKNYRPLNLSVNEVMDWVRKQGYEIWEIDPQQNRLVFLPGSKPEYVNHNFILTRPKTGRGKILSGLVFTSAAS